MSFKSSLVKTAVKWTPNKVMMWVGNFVLKDIAEITGINVDLDTRQMYVQTLLNGETEAIDVWVNGFAIIQDGETYRFVIQQAESNKPWLNNALAKITGREWKIPVIPKFKPYYELMAEVLQAESVPEESV